MYLLLTTSVGRDIIYFYVFGLVYSYTLSSFTCDTPCRIQTHSFRRIGITFYAHNVFYFVFRSFISHFMRTRRPRRPRHPVTGFPVSRRPRDKKKKRTIWYIFSRVAPSRLAEKRSCGWFITACVKCYRVPWVLGRRLTYSYFSVNRAANTYSNDANRHTSPRCDHDGIFFFFFDLRSAKHIIVAGCPGIGPKSTVFRKELELRTSAVLEKRTRGKRTHVYILYAHAYRFYFVPMLGTREVTVSSSKFEAATATGSNQREIRVESLCSAIFVTVVSGSRMVIILW